MIDVQRAQREARALAQQRQRREQHARVQAAGKGHTEMPAAQRAGKFGAAA
jgi:hypothetical protein